MTPPSPSDETYLLREDTLRPRRHPNHPDVWDNPAAFWLPLPVFSGFIRHQHLLFLAARYRLPSWVTSVNRKLDKKIESSENCNGIKNYERADGHRDITLSCCTNRPLKVCGVGCSSAHAANRSVGSISIQPILITFRYLSVN